jgi:hypothetical protein
MVLCILTIDMELSGYHVRFPADAVKRLLDLDIPVFLRLCYQLFLHRTAEPMEWRRDCDLLRTGTTKEELLCRFLSSPEVRHLPASRVKEIAAFLVHSGTLDFGFRDFLNATASYVRPDCRTED